MLSELRTQVMCSGRPRVDRVQIEKGRGPLRQDRRPVSLGTAPRRSRDCRGRCDQPWQRPTRAKLFLVAPLTRLHRAEPAVAVLTLATPERRNALSIAVRDEISDHLEALAGDPELKVLVVAAEGPVFCAGFDLREFERAMDDTAFADELWASSDRYHSAVATFPLVTVAAVSGPAIAGGFDLAVLCDLRVAASTAWFSHPEYAFGQVVYGPLHDLVGGALARRLTMTGERLSVEDALRFGLVSEVVEPDDVLAAALCLAQRAAVAPREVILDTKAKALRHAGRSPQTLTLDL